MVTFILTGCPFLELQQWHQPRARPGNVAAETLFSCFCCLADTALPQYWVFSNQMWQPKLKWALSPLYLLCYRKIGILKNGGNVKGWRKGNLKEDRESKSLQFIINVMILSNWHLENSYIDVNCDRIKIAPVRSKSVSVKFVCN